MKLEFAVLVWCGLGFPQYNSLEITRRIIEREGMSGILVQASHFIEGSLIPREVKGQSERLVV